MSASRVSYVGNGSTKTFGVTFPYISRTHVSVVVNGTLMLTPGDYSWASASVIEFNNAPLPGAVVLLERKTPVSARLVEFQNGAVLTEEELNLAVSQLLYKTQELEDYYRGTIESGLHRLNNGTAASAQEIIDATVQEIISSSALASLQERYDDISINGETLISHDTRLTSIQGIVDSFVDIDGTGLATYLESEQTARIEGDNALAQTISLIGAVSGDSLSFILDMDTTKVSPSESMSERFTAITSSVGDNAAAIGAESITRASETSALAATFDLLGAKTGDGSAFIFDAATALVSPGVALATRISQLQAGIDGKATITQWQEVRDDADDLYGKAGLQIDVDGHILGWSLHNDGDFGDFVIQADRFAVVTSGGSKVPFSVSGDTVTMQNVVIGNALIDNLNVNKLTTGTCTAQITQNGDLLMGTGRVLFDNGTRFRAQGTAFGSSSQYFDWFGPRPTGGNPNNATDGTATFYLKTNGDAFFGGTLKANIVEAGNIVNGAVSETRSGSKSTAGALTVSGHASGGFLVLLRLAALHSTINTASASTYTLRLRRRINAGGWTVLKTWQQADLDNKSTEGMGGGTYLHSANHTDWLIDAPASGTVDYELNWTSKAADDTSTTYSWELKTQEVKK